MEKGKFTVGLPIYNEEKTLRKTLDSLMINIDDIDYIIISDNASTDSTAEICKEYCGMCNKIQYYRNEQNIGSWQNMTKLFKRIKTEFYMQLGGHDYLSPNSIKTLRSEMKEDVVCCFGKVINQVKNNPIKDTYIKYKTKLESENSDERFIAYLMTGGANRAYYGIMKTETFREAMKKYGHYRGIGMDIVIMSYMALKGKLKYIPTVYITIFGSKESCKETYKRYRKYGMDVPYINPGKQFYKYIMQMVNENEKLRRKKEKIEIILNNGYGAYGKDVKWLLKHYKDIV